MILKTLHLKGFKGLRAGIGVEEAFIDFTLLPNGLVAIVGPNGAGKTTILDNCHPYRIMPYKLRKSKDWSPAAFSFYDQCYGSDAMKEFCFEMPGVGDFRSLLLIDADKRKQEAYLYRDDGAGGWIPLNDGKVKTYDETVEAVCGSPTLFFTSVFRAQGAKNLSDYTRGDIMAVISELLNIDHIKEQGEKGRYVFTALQGMVNTARAGIVALTDEIALLAGTSDRIGCLEDRLLDKRPALNQYETDLEATRASITELLQRKAAQESEKARIDQLRIQLADERSRHESTEAVISRQIADYVLQLQDATGTFTRLKDEAITKASQAEKNRQDQLQARLDDESSRFAAAADDLDKERTACERQLREIADALTSQREEIAGKIARAEKITGNAKQIRAKRPEETAAMQRLEIAKGEVQRLEAALTDLEAKERELSDIRKQIADTDLHVSQVAADRNVRRQQVQSALDHAGKDAAKLEGLDCRGDQSGWLNESCRFITDAVASKNAIERLAEELKALEAPTEAEDRLAESRARLEERVTAMADVPQQATDARQTLTAARKSVANIETELGELAKWTRLVPELEQAEENLRTWRQDLTDRETECATRTQEVAERNNTLSQKLADVKLNNDHRLAALRAQCDTALENIRAALRQDLADRETECESRLQDIRQQQDAATQRLSDIRAEHASREEDLQRRIAAFPVFEDLADRLAALESNERTQKDAIASIGGDIRSIELEIAGLKTKLEGVETKRREIAAAEARIERLNREIATFTLLSKACSNDGVIALELDDASPSIDIIVNDLLRACYGTRYSVQTKTQGENVSGDLKDIFDILVLDAEIGDEKSIFEASGGQIEWLEDAVTRGYCLFNIHRSVRVYGTMYSDEKDGKLDMKKKLALFAVKREALELGTHTRELFITQTPELSERADGWVILAPGQVLVTQDPALYQEHMGFIFSG